MKTYQVDMVALSMFRNLEQIDDAEESRLARQRRRDVQQTDWRDRVHLNFTFFHRVSVAHFDVRTHPYADAASDFTPANSIAKALGKHHATSVTISIRYGASASEPVGRG